MEFCLLKEECVNQKTVKVMVIEKPERRCLFKNRNKGVQDNLFRLSLKQQNTFG